MDNSHYLFDYLPSSPMEEESWFFCSRWSAPNHYLFQLANIFLILGYVQIRGKYGLLYLKCCIFASCVCFGLWGWLVLCALDTFLWNFIFTCINLFQISALVYQLYPFRVTLSAEEEMIYRQLFKPLGVSKNSFQNILIDNVADIQVLKSGECYAVQQATATDKLGLLFAGRVAVSCDGVTTTIIGEMCFLDAKNWFLPDSMLSQKRFSKETISALEESKIIIWDREELKYAMKEDAQLELAVYKMLGEEALSTIY